ncbi:hypothetical protein DV738_g3264, partial [Chaetothyriales sp. CBS 135597]
MSNPKAPPPLKGLKVLELGGLAPGPFCGLVLASYGASVIRIDRPGAPLADLLTTGKASVALDLKKSAASRELFTSLVRTADVLIDPFRPGVLEKLGFDPTTVLLGKLNPRLIVVRLTGFRRDGKYSQMAGHDINYLAVSGVLSLLGGPAATPQPPANLLADFGGGGLVAVVGVLLALLHRGGVAANGQGGGGGGGQVVEANMVDGVSYLGTFPRLLTKTPMWDSPRGTNSLDGGSPFYGTYECKDAGRYVSVGALEPQFFDALLRGLDLTLDDICPGGLDRNDKRSWPYMRQVFTARFKSKTRAEWESVFDGTDACVAPVLELAEMEKASYDLRPIVGLTASPGHVPQSDQEGAWVGKTLDPGEGGEDALDAWLGWKKGKHFDVDANGIWLQTERSKL